MNIHSILIIYKNQKKKKLYKIKMPFPVQEIQQLFKL